MAIKNILIVESPSDKAFVELVLKRLNLFNSTKTQTFETLDLHKFRDPESGKELRGKKVVKQRLIGVYNDITKASKREYESVERIGIILDADNEALDANMNLINEAIEGSFGTNPNFTNESQMIELDVKEGNQTFKLSFSSFLMKGLSDNGNLETVLLEIRKGNKFVPYADCLKYWRGCVEKSDSKLKVKEGVFNKMWLDNFMRATAYELSGKERKSILNDFEDQKHQIIERFGENLFDLDHKLLNSLKIFLSSFKSD